MSNSRITGLRGMTPQERRAAMGLGALPQLSDETADGMIENVVGTFALPLGVATNFIVNGRDVLVPLAVEEPSVVAAASNMARLARPEGFLAEADPPVMRGQIQVLDVPDLAQARAALLAAEDEIVAAANECDAVLVSLGGGCQGLEVHLFPQTAVGPMLVAHLLVDVRDAMGANAVNTMAEAVAPMIAARTGGRARLRILSNLADRRLARARVAIPVARLELEGFPGAEVARGIVEASAFAEADPYRAATHNKGIMNGIDPVVLATGNDWRAIEAGAHAYAAQAGRYTALSRWRVAEELLTGEIALPMAVGLVGGATKTHPGAQAALDLMGVTTAAELAEVIAAVGLAQNLGALRALATEGIQRGHMALHARNLAIAAGAVGPDVARVAERLTAQRDVSAERARAVLLELRG